MQTSLNHSFLSKLKMLLVLASMMCFLLLSKQANAEPEVELKTLVWEKRVVIGRPVSADAQQNLIKLLNVYQQEINARKLLFILPVKNQWLGFPAGTTAFSSESVSVKFSNNQQDEFVLIGLDGGVKRRFHSATFDLAKVFDLIDLMPMRRAELKQNRP